MSEGATISAPARACETADLSEPFERSVVIYLVVDDQPAMAVTRVFAVTDVREDEKFRCDLLDSLDRTLYYTAVVVGSGGVLIFMRRNSEEDDSADTERDGFTTLG